MIVVLILIVPKLVALVVFLFLLLDGQRGHVAALHEVGKPVHGLGNIIGMKAEQLGVLIVAIRDAGAEGGGFVPLHALGSIRQPPSVEKGQTGLVREGGEKRLIQFDGIAPTPETRLRLDAIGKLADHAGVRPSA